jgi:nitrogen fixation protein FixH
MENVTKKKSTKSAVFWMFVPVVLLVCSVSGWLVMVRVAVNDPGFSVEPDYYKKASHFDDEMAQRALNARLGFRSNIESFAFISGDEAELVVRLLDEEGRPISDAHVTAQAFFNARANEVHQVKFVALGDGRYGARLIRPHLGLWEVRLAAERGGLFSAVLRPELSAPVPVGSAS